MSVEQLSLTLEARGDENWEAVCQLKEPARSVIWAWLLELAWRGYGRVRVIDAVRDIDRQRRLFGKGRTAAECRKDGVPEEYAAPGEKQVTWSKPEESAHVQGFAVDVDISSYQSRDQQRIRDCARILGITCGADWTVRDMNHYEVKEREKC